VDNRSGFVTVNLEDTFGFVSNHDRIPGELLLPGQKYNFYIKDVKEQTKG
jgi:transcription antitermination factor NusA-like protein